MTSTQPQTREPQSAVDRAQTFIDWTRVNSRALTIGALIVIVAAGALWLWSRSKHIQEVNAEAALGKARISLNSGNLPLAQSDLKAVYTRYGSTTAGVEAAILLAQMDFDAGKYQDGIARLQQVADKGAASRNQSTIQSLIGDGYAQMGKLADAGKAYERAADATTGANDRAFQLAKAARVYQAAGNTEKAKELWTMLLNDEKAPTMVAEARIRLGELAAQPAKR